MRSEKFFYFTRTRMKRKNVFLKSAMFMHQNLIIFFVKKTTQCTVFLSLFFENMKYSKPFFDTMA